MLTHLCEKVTPHQQILKIHFFKMWVWHWDQTMGLVTVSLSVTLLYQLQVARCNLQKLQVNSYKLCAETYKLYTILAINK